MNLLRQRKHLGNSPDLPSEIADSTQETFVQQGNIRQEAAPLVYHVAVEDECATWAQKASTVGEIAFI